MNNVLSNTLEILKIVKHGYDNLYTVERLDGTRYPGWYTKKDAFRMKKLITAISDLHDRQIALTKQETEVEHNL